MTLIQLQQAILNHRGSKDGFFRINEWEINEIFNEIKSLMMENDELKRGIHKRVMKELGVRR